MNKKPVIWREAWDTDCTGENPRKIALDECPHCHAYPTYGISPCPFCGGEINYGENAEADCAGNTRMTVEKEGLVPCPGCGGNDLKECYVCGDHFVACQTCGWTGPMKNTPAESRLAWNTRAAVEMEGME